MIKRSLFFYSFLLLVYMVLSARSCGDEENSNELSFLEETDRYEQELSSPSPNIGMLRAFEEKAIQKVRDHIDYLNILSDPAITRIMKENVQQQNEKLFLRSGNDLSTIIQKLSEDKFNIQNEQLDQTSFFTYNISGAITILSPLHLVKDQIKSGSLSYLLILNSQKDSTTSSPKDLKVKMDFYLERTTKYFGLDSLKVWQVYLAEPRILDLI